MRVGVIGLGVIAPYFLRAIARSPDLRLMAVCDRDDARVAAFAPRGVAGLTDYRAVLDRDKVDAVFVTLPNHLHREVVAAALAQGIHVCCEKPLTVRSDEAASLCELAQAANVTLFTAFHRRYNRHVRVLARRLPAPAAIASITCRYQENINEHTGGEAWYLDPVRCGGGCLVDNGPNVLDTLRFLLGDIRLIDCELSRVRDGVEFGARLKLESADGVPADVLLDWDLPTGEMKDVTVHLKDGSVLVGDMLAGYPGFKSSLVHEYAAIVADFCRAVESGGEFGADGASVTTLIENAYAIARGRTGAVR